MQTKELIAKLRCHKHVTQGDGLSALMDTCEQAADALEATLWRPNTQKPAKPGTSNYEYVDCWIVKDGKVIERPWNCEHECFDDQEYDDWFCNMEDVSAWMPIVKPTPPEAE